MLPVALQRPATAGPVTGWSLRGRTPGSSEGRGAAQAPGHSAITYQARKTRADPTPAAERATLPLVSRRRPDSHHSLTLNPVAMLPLAPNTRFLQIFSISLSAGNLKPNCGAAGFSAAAALLAALLAAATAAAALLTAAAAASGAGRQARQRTSRGCSPGCRSSRACQRQRRCSMPSGLSTCSSQVIRMPLRPRRLRWAACPSPLPGAAASSYPMAVY